MKEISTTIRSKFIFPLSFSSSSALLAHNSTIIRCKVKVALHILQTHFTVVFFSCIFSYVFLNHNLRAICVLLAQRHKVFSHTRDIWTMHNRQLDTILSEREREFRFREISINFFTYKVQPWPVDLDLNVSNEA